MKKIGVLVPGPVGSGKAGKAFAEEWLKSGIELMRPTEEELVIQRVFRKLMKESEGNIKRVIKLVDNTAPCILWLDDEYEIEMAMKDYEKWSQELEEVFGEEVDEWCEGQIELSKHLKRMEMHPELAN